VGPSILEGLHYPRQTAALVSSVNSLLGAIAGLVLMRFTDRHGPRSIVVYPALAVPVQLLLGLGLVSPDAFLLVLVLGSMLLSGMHYGVQSIAGVYYPSAIRASGGGWASSVAKLGAVLGPLVGAAVLSSGMPVLRSFALLAVCLAVDSICMLGIAAVVRG